MFTFNRKESNKKELSALEIARLQRYQMSPNPASTKESNSSSFSGMYEEIVGKPDPSKKAKPGQ